MTALGINSIEAKSDEPAHRVDESFLSVDELLVQEGEPSRRAKDMASKRKDRWVLGAAAAWLMVVAGGSAVLIEYASRQGAIASAPAVWPAESGLPHVQGMQTLIMFVHPKCPCSNASVSELSKVISHAPSGLKVIACVVKPPGAPGDWAESDLVWRIKRLPGAQVVIDDGREAARFGATVSGHVLVYGPDGGLTYCGGITLARGHEGDNLGEDAVIRALGSAEPTRCSGPTYGCPLSAAAHAIEAKDDR